MAMRGGAVVISVKTVILQNQNWKLYISINWIWCHILLLSWTLDSCKLKNTGDFFWGSQFDDAVIPDMFLDVSVRDLNSSGIYTHQTLLLHLSHSF